MRLARVVGNVVSTIKNDDYYGYKLMIIEWLDENGNTEGKREIAFDAGQAGIGDVVLVNTDGGAANMLLCDKNIVADVTIAGVIDRFTYGGKTTKLR